MKYILSTLCLLFLSMPLISQNLSDTYWYFGDNAEAVQFEKNQGRASFLIENQGTPFSNNGSAVAANGINGNLLFYTDGNVVYDQNHEVMPGGTNLGANTALRQPVTISPSPEDNSSIYYAYLINASNELQYVSIDMSAGTAGEVTTAAVGTAYNNVAPYIQSLKYGDQLILLFQHNNTLELARIENDGSLTSIASHTFSIPYAVNNADFRVSGQDSIQFAFSSEQVAGISKNIILLDLDVSTPATPSFSNEQILSNSASADRIISDVSWSSTGINLLYSRNDISTNEAQLLLYDPSDSSTNDILNRNIPNVYALQRGPDGEVYFLYDNSGSSYLSSINYTDSIADSTRIDWNRFNQSFQDARNFSLSAPPSNINANVAFDWYSNQLNSSICQNNPVSFFPDLSELDDITGISWDFGTGQSSDAISPIVAFEEAGTFTVSMRVNAGGNIFIDSTTINVTQVDAQVQLQDTTVCELPLENYGPTLSDGSEPDDITWIGLDSTRFEVNADGTANFFEAGTYTAAVTVNGCVISASFQLTLFEQQQQSANFWYFGDGAGIDFNPEGGPVPVTDGAIVAEEGCATVSDANGNLLFYTNGDLIWNSDHQIMPNGSNLGGDPMASQGVISVQHATDPTLYYLFLAEDAASDSNRFSIALVDMKLEDGLGDVVLKERKLFSRATEKVAAAGVMNTEVLIHELGSNTYRFYPVNDNGIESPNYVSQGVTFNNQSSAFGYLKYAAGGDKIAQVSNESGATIEYLRRDSAATNWEVASINVDFGGEVYGLAFSPNEDYLYATIRNGGSSNLVQIPILDDYSIEDIENPDSVTVADISFDAGAIQRGPDGQLYVASNNEGFVYTIGGADIRYQPDEGSNLAAILTQFDLAGATSLLGLPNFVQNQASPEREPTISVIANCSSEDIILSATGVTNFDQYSWTITEAGTSTNVYTSNTQNDTVDVDIDPGRYEASVRITNECGYDELLVETFELFASPDLSNVVTPRVLCGNNITLGENIPDSTSYSYAWSTGDSTRTIDVSEEGIYTISVTTQEGCNTTVDIFVVPPFEVNLGGNRSICQDENLRLDAGVNANTYRWYVDDIQQPNSGQNFDVDTSVPGTYIIRVEVPDPSDTSCFAQDEIEVIINENPDLSIVQEIEPTCGGNNGIIEISIDPTVGSGDFSVNWDGPTAVAANSRIGNNLSAGTYNITVTDNLTSCSYIETIVLSNDDFIVNASQVNINCTADNQQVSVNLTANSGSLTAPYDWNILDQTGNLVDNGSSGSNPFIISGLSEGTYSIEVIDAGGSGCFAGDDFTIVLGDSVDFNPDEEVFGCGNTYDLEAYVQSIAAAGVTFTFETASGAAIADPSTVSSGDYRVIADNGSDCPSEAIITVNLTTAADLVDISSQVDCNAGGNILTAVLGSGQNPANFSFNWSNGASGQRIRVSQAGTYRVTAYPTDNISCVDTLSFILNNVFTPLNVQLTSETNCEDGTIVATATIEGGTGNYNVTFRNSAGTNIPLIDPSGQAYEWVISESDNYTLRVDDQGPGACSEVINRAFTVTETYEPTLEPSYVICRTGLESERSVLLDAGSFGTYEWRLPDGSVRNTRTIVATTPGRYEVTLTAAGCTYEIFTNVLEDCRPKVFAPDAIKPSSSIAINQTFSVFSNDYVDNFQIVIFNRWGNIVFESKNKDFKWDATDLNGEPVPQGMYAYIINFTNIDNSNGRVYEQKGGVNVIR